MVQPWWVQTAEWPTTVPSAAARITEPDGPSTMTAPADSTSATEASGVPVGAAAVSVAGAAVVGISSGGGIGRRRSSAVVGATVVAAAADDAAADDEGAAEVAAAVDDELVVGVVGVELQAAAAASTAVPEAARTVRRGRLRVAGVTGILQVCSIGSATDRHMNTPHCYSS